jgi:putative transposase
MMGITRSAHYQALKRAAIQAKKEALLWQKVLSIRTKHRQMGGRKLYHLVSAYMAEIGLKMGRDGFFRFLRERSGLVQRKRRYCKTTQSGETKFENLVSDIELSRVNEAWVSDITYIACGSDWLYLSLVTDLYSRRIVGYHLSEDLSAKSCVAALELSIKTVGKLNCKGVIHHSDHGVQYSCPLYRDHLSKISGRSSMGAVGNCYDNAVAERVNGILKQEYGLYARFSSYQEAQKSVSEAIWLYNEERPHWSLNLKTPAAYYKEHLTV